MIDLSKIALDKEADRVYRTMGIKLYVDHYNKETYINKHYWRYLPDIAKSALVLIYEDSKKENNNDANNV